MPAPCAQVESAAAVGTRSPPKSERGAVSRGALAPLSRTGEMTLGEAVEVLNRFQHNEHSDWYCLVA